MPMRVGIYANLHKPKVWSEVPAYIRWLYSHDVEIILDDALSAIDHLDDFEFAHLRDAAPTLDVVLSFGGDGTLLSCVREVGLAETPILGINLGGLGYLAELSVPQLYKMTEQMLTGEFDVEERMLLSAIKSGGNSKPIIALNDFVLDRAGHSRMIRIRASIDDEYLNTYTADGIIVSTPTGSTGYSLSAGGPILEPTLDNMILIPTCPHTLAHRPLVMRSDRKLKFETEVGFTAALMADGAYVDQLEYGETIEVSRAPFNVKLVSFTGKYFYQVLREKLRWGEDGRYSER